MNLKKHMQHHETSVNDLLMSNSPFTDWRFIREQFEQTISFMQHERLVHLMVTLSFGLFLLISTAIAIVRPCHQSLVLMGIFLLMLAPYVAHYFYLENTIQHWYKLMDDINEKVQQCKID